MEWPAPGPHSASTDTARLTGGHFIRSMQVPSDSQKQRVQRACYSANTQHTISGSAKTLATAAENVPFLSAWSRVVQSVTLWRTSKTYQSVIPRKM